MIQWLVSSPGKNGKKYMNQKRLGPLVLQVREHMYSAHYVLCNPRRSIETRFRARHSAGVFTGDPKMMDVDAMIRLKAIFWWIDAMYVGQFLLGNDGCSSEIVQTCLQKFKIFARWNRQKGNIGCYIPIHTYY